MSTRGETETPYNIEEARERLASVFLYLRELHVHRHPAKRLLEDQPWVLRLDGLPDHPAIQRGTVDTEASGEDAAGAFLLRVERPDLTEPPEPPAILRDWLERGWDDPLVELRVRASANEKTAEGDTIVVSFEASPERMQARQAWAVQRDAWATNERPSREVMRVFERLYELRGRLEREGETIDLVIGDGMLDWPRPDGRIHHPILLQHVDLQFETGGSKPAFTIVETERGPELYTGLLHSLPDVEPAAVARWRAALDQENYHPLGHAASGFLRHIVVQLTSHGEFVEQGPIKGEVNRPRIGRAPALFLRGRAQGYAAAIEAVLEDLEGRQDLPAPLIGIVGIEAEDRGSAEPAEPAATSPHEEAEDVLLSKPANPEQVRIVRQLARTAGVLVQGPPGTGKSHTIANLIGHLLAEGQSVLVTAHTTKALRVLREYVPDTLQPLCVSVLDNDLDGNRQLDRSVEGIIERLSESNAGRLGVEAAALSQHRQTLIERIRSTRQDLLKVREGEYRDIVVSGKTFTPADAARKVARDLGSHGWIPGPVTIGAPLPLSDAEVIDLYHTNASVPTDDERELDCPLPDPAKLPTPAAFETLVTDRQALSDEDRDFGWEYWDQPPREEESEDIAEHLARRLERAVATIGKGETWRLAVVADSKRGGGHRVPWDTLLRSIRALSREAADARDTLFRFGPALPSDVDLELADQMTGEILDHLEQRRGSLGTLTLLVHPGWKRFLEVARVGGRPPALPEHLRALRTLVRLRQAREELVRRWDRQMVPLGASPLSADDEHLEAVLEQWTGHIRECLEWHAATWAPAEADLRAAGFRWDAFLAAQPVNTAPYGDLLRLRDAVTTPLLQALAARARAVRWRHLDAGLSALQAALATYGSGKTVAAVLLKLRDAVERLDPVAYGSAFGRLSGLHSARGDLDRRRALLTRLDVVAPAWAAAIRQKVAPHDEGTPPGDVTEAWLWRQLHDELDYRNRLSLHDLERRVEALAREVRRTTADLIDRRSWAAQARRTSLRQQQALMGWAQTVRRIGRGTGRYAPRLRRDAARLMNECRTAVPVWIMPLARVAEQFDPRKTRFDVVIIDEASQSDVMALLACYLGRKVVVVGDHEQVSPLAVGQDLDVVQRLIAAHLQEIPNSHLYDGRMSVYDLGRQSFGQPIMLVEHFRCVPDIIQFSNWLSYDWKIRPLRDASGVALKPHVVPYRVPAAGAAGEVNRDEVVATASLIAAAIEQPEYAGKTFGVITLVGEAQALEIEKLLRQRLDVAELERRRIVCGNAAHFQGDERDVVFLSMVDTSTGAPLRLRRDDRFKQRYNVAASRARDQLWVVYSLDPLLDLQPDDLRRELIEHAVDPSRRLRTLEQAEHRVESELEREVLRRLLQSGYRVRPQWKVGHYRIDLVVEGGGKRLAVECDGDRWHPPEKLAEDLERQAILERLGWTFARVRGTQFFRDPDQAVAPVLETLDRLGIPPEGPDTPAAAPSRSELLERVVRRAEERRREWFDSAVAGGTLQLGQRPSLSDDLTDAEHRVLDALRGAGRPLRKAEILAMTGLSEAEWSQTIVSLRRRGLAIQRGTRRGTSYELP